MNKPTILDQIDWVDRMSLPLFVASMLAEANVLSNRDDLRLPESLDSLTKDELASPHEPADPLIPVGYERSDTIASLSMLVGNVTVNLAMGPLLSKLSHAIFNRRVADLGKGPWGFVASMIAWDFLYYWSHRFQHERRIFWANHVAHHSSRHYNLSTALRQPWATPLMTWVYLPMPFLGFSSAQTAKAGQLNLLYQYWIHTETVDRLPDWVEKIFNTPSHHRVHHGANPQYLDKNYGGVLIIWDKLFKTFEPEHRQVKYGLTRNIETFNPIKIAYHEFADIACDVKRTKGWRSKIGRIVNRPGHR